MIVVFAGTIGRFPVGGHAWVDMQYLLGLRELGHEVFYLEECGAESWVYNWETDELTTDLEYPTSYIQDCLAPFGFGTRWIYRAGERCVGMASEEFRDVCSQADLLMVRGSPIDLWRAEYDWPRRRIFIDSDPVFTQIKLAKGHRELLNTVDRCDHLFTVGQRVGLDGCTVPTTGRRWRRMLPPVSLAHWPEAESVSATHFTAVMQWRSYRDVVHEGIAYGNKDREFPKFIDLPRHTKQRFRIALTGGVPQEMTTHGWEPVQGWVASRTPDAYQRFICDSRAEFGVAKHGYVVSRGGWVSDRSACYLASGRPILVQDTGLGDSLPTGEGLLTFRDLADAVRGIETINTDYDGHRRAARQLAEEYFAADQVLENLIDLAME